MSLCNLVVKHHIYGMSITLIIRLCLMYSMNQIKNELTTTPPSSSFDVVKQSNVFALEHKQRSKRCAAFWRYAVHIFMLTSQNKVCRLTQLTQSFVLIFVFTHASFFF